MILRVNKKRVQEGDIVEVSWECPGASSAKITIDNGYKSSSVNVENEGVKRFKLNRSKGSTVIAIEALVGDNTLRRSARVRVISAKKAESSQQKYDHYKRLDNHPLREKFKAFLTRNKYKWQMLSPQKRQAFIILSILCPIIIVANFYPKFLYYGVLAIAIYLFSTILSNKS